MWKYFLWSKCNIASHKSFRDSFGNHLKNTFVWKAGVPSINVAPVQSFTYIFMHSVDSVIHVFTHSQGPSVATRLALCVCACLCMYVCVTCGTALLFCGLVLFPRGLSSFTEPWQRMEAGRGVRCIKKPLPSSDLSPLPRTHTYTHTQKPAYQPHTISPFFAAAQLYTLSKTETYRCMRVCSRTHTYTHSHTIKHMLIPS